MSMPSDLRTDLLSPSIPDPVPSSRAARDRRRPEQYYVGRRPQETEVYVVSHATVEPLDHHCYRSSAPFDWGAESPGALELAYAMLAHSTDSAPPDPICLAFWAEVVACLDRSGFVLGRGEIALWLLTAFAGGEEPPPKRGRRLRDRIRRIRPWRRGR